MGKARHRAQVCLAGVLQTRVIAQHSRSTLASQRSATQHTRHTAEHKQLGRVAQQHNNTTHHQAM